MVVGEIEADGLEGDVTADWGALFENSTAYQEVRQWAQARLKESVKEVFTQEELIRIHAAAREAIEGLSVFDNVAMIHEHSRAKRAARRDDVEAAIEFVGLDVPSRTKVGRLRAHERRLVEVARAVVGAPRVVLLDEPAAGLPDEETRQLGTVIQRIPGKFGALVILVDHDMSLVSDCCQTTAVVDFGKLIASGPTPEILRNEHVMRAYLGTEATL